FEIIGPIRDVETIARGHGIRVLGELQRQFGTGRWRKLKGIATVELATGEIRLAEVHWYEAAGIGRRRMKIKRYLDQ
ncbi:MAG TPA: hypothetical protein VNP72_04875, partial [Longimicrobium sp.]|nr:hypothetical protein [Longimicrobium sp.]